MKFLSITFLALSVFFTGCTSSNSEGYTDLFNGKDFSGWEGTAGMDSYKINFKKNLEKST